MDDPPHSRLRNAFEYVRSTFFPEWEAGGEWAVQEDDDPGSYGRCDDATKAILVRSPPPDPDDDRLHLVLIHEICHAVSKEPHTRRWRHRFMEAGDTASSIGRNDLARMIQDEVRRYQALEKPLKLDERLIYATIQDVVLPNPAISYRETIRTVAGWWEVSVEDVLGFEDCRKVFEDTKRMIVRLMAETKIRDGE